MVSLERWDVDRLFASIRSSYPYRHLSRKAFDLVLSMLAGRYEETRVRELKSRVSLDLVDNTVQGKEGVLRMIYTSGGTIPDRGYYDLRIEDSRALVGELDEEFVWERSIGDTFTLGAHVWQIRRITHNDVEVVPVEAKPGIFPFWKAEDLNRDFHFSEKILLFLEGMNERLGDPGLREELRREYFLDDYAADELTGYLKRQREATGIDLPHRHLLLIEHFQDPLNTSDTKQVILHTLWGGRVNRPFGLALRAAWEEKYHYHLEVIENNDCLLLMLPHDFSAREIFSLVRRKILKGCSVSPWRRAPSSEPNSGKMRPGRSFCPGRASRSACPSG
jgi:ATP-dependent Lhr-like helicase